MKQVELLYNVQSIKYKVLTYLRVKNLIIYIGVFIYSPLQAQFQDHFSDGNITQSPVWEGDVTYFEVDSSPQRYLHLNAPEEPDTSYISTQFKAVNEAQWVFYVRMDFNPSSSNYTKIFLMSSKSNLNESLKGYYLMIGNTDDALTLYKQNGTVHLKLINGPNGMLSQNHNDMNIKITRSSQGEFKLYVDTTLNGTFLFLGDHTDTEIMNSSYFGIQCVYTASRSDKFYFDDIQASGTIPPDHTPPHVDSLWILNESALQIQWSEDIQTNLPHILNNITLNPGNIHPTGLDFNTDEQLTLYFAKPWSSSQAYALRLQDISDAAGQTLHDTSLSFVYPALPQIGDLVINEVLFYPREGSYDFVEIYNRSKSYLKLDSCYLGNTEHGVINNLKLISTRQNLAPNEYWVITKSRDNLGEQYPNSNTQHILELSTMPTYAMEEGTVVFLDRTKTVLDSLHYTEDMHFDLLYDVQGVSLERISANLPSQQNDNWQSASEDAGFATPGYLNSQSRDIETTTDILSLDKPIFSPNNDGFEDVLELNYHLPSGGYMANIYWFDLEGRLLHQTLNNQYVGTDGVCFWNGENEDQAILPGGIYIVMAEFIKPDAPILYEKRAFALVR